MRGPTDGWTGFRARDSHAGRRRFFNVVQRLPRRSCRFARYPLSLPGRPVHRLLLPRRGGGVGRRRPSLAARHLGDGRRLLHERHRARRRPGEVRQRPVLPVPHARHLGRPEARRRPRQLDGRPPLADIGTALLAYCQKAATGNDLLITGRLGRGMRLRRLLARAGAGHVHGAHRTLSAPYRTGSGLRVQPPQCGRRRMGSLRRVRCPLLPGPHAGARHHPVLGDGGFPDQARGRAGDRRLLPAGKGGGVPVRAAQAHQGLGRRLTAVHRGGEPTPGAGRPAVSRSSASCWGSRSRSSVAMSSSTR